MISKLSKFILLSRPGILACVYPCVVSLISVLVFFIDIPAPSFVRQHSIVEQIANYLGYSVSIILFIFVFLTRLTFAYGRILPIIPAVLRILFNVVISVTALVFMKVLSIEFGYCHGDDTSLSLTTCLQKGYTWKVLSLPKTSFITCFATLVALEESSVYEEWETIQEMVLHKFEYTLPVDDSAEEVCDHPKGFEDIEVLITLHAKLNLLVEILLWLLAVILLALHLDNLLVLIFWPSPIWKIIDTLIPVVIWLLTYKLVYRLQICTLAVNINKRRIEEFFSYTEESTERNNLIEEIVWINDVKGRTSRFLFNIFKYNSYENL